MSDTKSLAEGIRDIKDYTKKDTLLLGGIFTEEVGSPFAKALERVVENKVKGYYYLLAHLPDERRTIPTTSLISGIIQALEQVLGVPKEFVDAAEDIKKADKEEAEKSKGAK